MHMDTLANHWPLTPSHQDPQPIRSQSSQWEVPDLCHRPMTKEDTRIHAYTHIHTDRQEGRQRREGKREERKQEKKKDSHIYSKVKQNRLLTPRGTEK